MIIKNIQASNFKCIAEVDLSLPPLTVLIGPNGAGKSTFLASVEALSHIARGTLESFFAGAGGYSAAMFVGATKREIRFSAGLTDNAETYTYELILVPEGISYKINEESLGLRSGRIKDRIAHEPHKKIAGLIETRSFLATKNLLLHRSGNFSEFLADDGRIVNPRVTDAPAESLLDLASNSQEEISSVSSLFRNVFRWNSVELDLRGVVRIPQQLEPANFALPSGENIFSVMYVLKTQRPDEYADLIEFLRIANPDLDYIEFPLVGRGYVTLDWWRKGANRPFNAQQLSDGTLRLLWIATALYAAPDDSVILIDEPETSMHPQWLMLLAGLFRQMSARLQIIVATHSDQLIRWIQPEELLVADIEDGVSRFRWGNDMGLEEWLKDYTLDELWLMGELGGRR